MNKVFTIMAIFLCLTVNLLGGDIISTPYGDYQVENGSIYVEGVNIRVGIPYRKVIINGEEVSLRLDGGRLFSLEEVDGTLKRVTYNYSYFVRWGRLVAIF